MSGPKDYSYSYSAELEERIEEQLIALRRERASQIARNMREVAPKARQRVEQILAKRVEANRQANAERRQRIQAKSSGKTPAKKENVSNADAAQLAQFSVEVSTARNELTQLAETLGDLDHSSVLRELEKQVSALESLQSDGNTDSSSVEIVQQRIHQEHKDAKQRTLLLSEQLQQVAGWQESLSQDEDVQKFQSDEHAAWQKEANSLLIEQSQHHTLDAAITTTEDVILHAKQIHEQATELTAQFQARNDLLLTIMDSLKEIGFFVSDPMYSDTSDPSGPIILKASKGGEDMTTWVDLSENIRSHWDNSDGEHCKESFFDYVEEMNKHGVSIKAERADLQARPILKRKGAKDLPTTKKDRRGA